MNKLKTTIVPMLVIAALAGAVLQAEANPLPPGSITPAAGIPFPGGTELDSVYYEDVGEANLIADISSAVYRAVGGTLDFYYQVSNDSVTNLVHRLTGSDFTGFLTDVWFVTNGAAIACDACPGGFFENGTQDPLTMDRDSAGEVVGFNFPTPGFEVNPGETSLVLLIQTNATVYEPGFVAVINSGTATEEAFDPGVTPPVPEPASMLLFGIGLFGTAAAMRRKQRKA